MMEDLNKHPLVLQYRKAWESSGYHYGRIDSDIVLRFMQSLMGEESNEIMARDVYTLCCLSSDKTSRIGNFRFDTKRQEGGKLLNTSKTYKATNVKFRDLNIEVEYYEPDYIDDEYHHSYWRWVRKSEEDLTLLMLAGK